MPSSDAAGDVDVVVAHGHVGDDLQARAPGAQHRLVDAISEHAHDPVDLRRPLGELIRRERLVVDRRPHELVAGLHERVEATLGERSGDEDAGQGAAQYPSGRSRDSTVAR